MGRKQPNPPPRWAPDSNVQQEVVRADSQLVARLPRGAREMLDALRDCDVPHDFENEAVEGQLLGSAVCKKCGARVHFMYAVWYMKGLRDGGHHGD